MSTLTDISLNKALQELEIRQEILDTFYRYQETPGEDVRIWKNVPGAANYPRYYWYLKHKLGAGLVSKEEERIWNNVQALGLTLRNTVSAVDYQASKDLLQPTGPEAYLVVLYGRYCLKTVFDNFGLNGQELARILSLDEIDEEIDDNLARSAINLVKSGGFDLAIEKGYTERQVIKSLYRIAS